MFLKMFVDQAACTLQVMSRATTTSEVLSLNLTSLLILAVLKVTNCMIYFTFYSLVSKDDTLHHSYRSMNSGCRGCLWDVQRYPPQRPLVHLRGGRGVSYRYDR